MSGTGEDMKHIEDIKKKFSLNGMPCHRYIIRHLASQKDILIFEKIFVETFLSYEYCIEDIEKCLCLLPQYIQPNSPISGQQFDIMGKFSLSDNIVYNLCLDSSIPKYKNCSAYYKTIDEYCHACQLCPYSAKYKNSLQMEELQLVRFAFSSPAHYEIVKKSHIKITHFKSVEDVMNVCASAKEPLLYPLSKNLYKVLSATADKYFQSTQANCAFDYKIRSKIASDILKTHLPSECYQHNWIEKIIDIWEESFFNTPVCNENTAQQYIDALLHREKYAQLKKHPVKAKKTDAEQTNIDIPPSTHLVGLNEYIKQMQLDPDLTEPIPTTDDTTDHLPPVLDEDCSMPINPLPVQDTITPTEEISSCSSGNGIPLHEAECQDNVDPQITERTLNLSADYIEIIEKNDTLYETAIPIKSHTIPPYSSAPFQIEKLNMGENLIYFPKVHDYELEACSVSLDTRNALILSKFETAIMSTKRMAIEIIKNEHDQRMILVWVPSLRTFFHSTLTDPFSSEVIFSLISRRSILKITYSPYLLCSMIYHIGSGQVRNLQSLQTMHDLVATDNFDFISSMRSNGITAAIPGMHFKSKRMVTSEVFLYMPFYSTVYRKMCRLLKSQNCEDTYETHSRINEFLGASYDLQYYFTGLNKDFLFFMPRPLFIKFTPVDMRHLSQSGYVVTYDLDYLENPKQPVLSQVLYLLCSTGRLRNLSVQLIEYFEKKIVLFVTEIDYEYFTDLMTHTLFDISSQLPFEVTFHTAQLHVSL